MGRPRELSVEERADLLRRGYRPVEVWVPDVENPAYLENARRQAAASVDADRRAGIEELIDPSTTDDWDKV